MRTKEKKAENIEKEVVRGSHLAVVVFVIFLKSGFSINEELAISCSHFCSTGCFILRLQILEAEAFGTALHAPVVELGAGQPECCRTARLASHFYINFFSRITPRLVESACRTRPTHEVAAPKSPAESSCQFVGPSQYHIWPAHENSP
jgi:hypothetical protein